MPKDASLDLFLGLYVQVWCLQLLKERARGALLTPCVLALAAAVAFAGAALVRRRHKHEARKAVAAAGLYYLARRGSSSNHVLLQALLAVAVLEARGGDALRAYGRQLLGALYGTTRPWRSSTTAGSTRGAAAWRSSRRRASTRSGCRRRRGRSSRRSRASASSPRSRSRSPSCCARRAALFPGAGPSRSPSPAARSTCATRGAAAAAVRLPLLGAHGAALFTLGLSDGSASGRGEGLAWAGPRVGRARRGPQITGGRRRRARHTRRTCRGTSACPGARWRSSWSRATPSRRRRGGRRAFIGRRWPRCFYCSRARCPTSACGRTVLHHVLEPADRGRPVEPLVPFH